MGRRPDWWGRSVSFEALAELFSSLFPTSDSMISCCRFLCRICFCWVFIMFFLVRCIQLGWSVYGWFFYICGRFLVRRPWRLGYTWSRFDPRSKVFLRFWLYCGLVAMGSFWRCRPFPYHKNTYIIYNIINIDFKK